MLRDARRGRTDGVLAAVIDEQAQHALVLQVLHELRIVDGPVVLRPVAPDAGDDAHRSQRRAFGHRRLAAAASIGARVAPVALLLLILVTTCATAAGRQPQPASRRGGALPHGKQQPSAQRRAAPDGDATAARNGMCSRQPGCRGRRCDAGGPHRARRRPRWAPGRAAAAARGGGSAQRLQAAPPAKRSGEDWRRFASPLRSTTARARRHRPAAPTRPAVSAAARASGCGSGARRPCCATALQRAPAPLCCALRRR